MESLFIILRICVVYTTLLAVVHLQNWHIWSSAAKPPPVCTSVECVKLGKIYEQNMDTSMNPCNDFYHYACSHWKMHTSELHHIVPELMWNINTFLEIRALKRMKTIMEEKTPSESKELERAKEVYRTCMDIPFLARSKPDSVRDLMKKIAVFPIFLPNNKSLDSLPSYAEIDLTYMKMTGESAFFGFSIQTSETVTKDIITELGPQKSAYGALVRVQDWVRANELAFYKTFLTRLLKSVADYGFVIPMNVLNKDLNDLIEFREKLNSIISKQESNEVRDIMTIQDFQKWYNLQSNTPNNAQINWLSVIRAIYRSSDDPRTAKIRMLANVKVHSAYFKKLADLLRKTPKRVIVNHILFYFAERHIELDHVMKMNLKRSIQDCGLRATGIIRGDVYRWKECIETNNMKTALAKAYVQAFFPPKQKAHVQALFEKAKEILKDLIIESTWLDMETKKLSVNKIDKIKSLIGYPDWYDKPTTARSPLPELNPLESTASYRYEFNRVTISAAHLQPPVYGPDMPFVIDYATTVNLMGHELHHAFDDEGIKYNANGQTPWWKTQMLVDYTIHRQAFRQQYKAYKFDTFKDLSINASGPCNFEDTVTEDVADVMGLKLAYKGYQMALKENNGVCPVLPGFETFGCDKLFFIAFANNYCSALTDGDKEVVFTQNVHNLPQIRVNGAVANMKEFRDAFNCKRSDHLYVNQTLDLWSP